MAKYKHNIYPILELCVLRSVAAQ